MKKISLSILVLFALLVGACAPAATPTAAPAAAVTQAAAAPTTAAPTVASAIEAPAAEQPKCAVEGGTIKVGMIIPLTGAAATMGGRIRNGATLAVEEINKKGGVLGCTLELIIEDSQADAAVAVAAAEKLINKDKVQTMIGAYHSHTTLAIMPKLPDAKVPMLELIATGPKITDENNGWMLRISSTNAADANTAVKQCQDDINTKKWAFLYVNNDWGKSVPAGYTPVIESAGGQVVLKESLEQGTTNFLSQLTKVRASGADTVAVTIDIESLSVIAKQAFEAGMTDKYTWIATSGQDLATFLTLLKDVPEAAEGWYSTAYFRSPDLPGGDTPQNIAFFENYSKKYPEVNADYPASQGYMAVGVTVAAIERAGKYEGEAIRDAMKKTDYQGLNANITFDDKGQAILKGTYFAEVVDGKVVPKECK